MKEICGCCEGVRIETPVPVENRPGLDALQYRVGTHFAFLESMKARLGLLELPPGTNLETLRRPLAALHTRETDDPALALLDAWAIVADVLTFYQERIANEGYLRTALERFSIVSLANLVGYRPRPGVAASVYLAYTLETGSDVTIPSGSRAQSIPGPGELPQSFETSSPLEARFAWNNLIPRLTRPQHITQETAENLLVLYLDGLVTRLKPNSPLLFVFGAEAGLQRVRIVSDVEMEPAQARTKVTLLPTTAAVLAPPIAGAATASPSLGQSAGTPPAVSSPAAAPTGLSAPDPAPVEGQPAGQPAPGSAAPAATQSDTAGPVGLTKGLNLVLDSLHKSPAVVSKDPPRRELEQVFAPASDAGAQLLLAVDPNLDDTLYEALANAVVAPPPTLENLLALRIKAAPFGHNAPRKPILDGRGIVKGTEEWPLSDPSVVGVVLDILRPPPAPLETKTPDPPGFGLGGRAENPPQPAGSAAAPFTASATLFTQADGDAAVSQTGPLAVRTQAYDAGMPVNVTMTDQARSLTFEFVPGQGKQTQTIAVATVQDSPVLTVTVNTDRPRLVVLGQTVQYRQADTTVKITTDGSPAQLQLQVTIESQAAPLSPRVLLLDATYDQILPESWVVIIRPRRATAAAAVPAPGAPGAAAAVIPPPGPSGAAVVPPPDTDTLYARVKQVDTVSPALYGLVATVTRLTLYSDWLYEEDRRLDVMRNTTVYAQSEKLTLVDEPVAEPVSKDVIPLDALVDGLKPGRWLIVSGERTGDAASGVHAAELVQVAEVNQEAAQVSETDKSTLPGDSLHSFLTLVNPLSFQYKRDTVTIFGNVVPATHGETRREPLGGGDGSQKFQAFALHQKPLTFISAATPSGHLSTLQVRVNDLLWHEADSLNDLGPNDHGFITQTSEDDTTSIVFGNGVHGARLPSGADNIRAVYRSGLGAPGNLQATRISQLATRPLGVKGVINPLPATGGADREKADAVRSNAPLGVKALDRLVSVQDYEDFSQTFAGIGKARAVLFPGDGRPLVHVSAAGADNIPIADHSALLDNLIQSLRDFGDPDLAVEAAPATRTVLMLSAGISLLPDYEWMAVEPLLRAAMVSTFGFGRRDLGQTVWRSEAVAALQNVEGVARVTFSVFDAFALQGVEPLSNRLAQLAGMLTVRDRITARLAGFDPAATPADPKILPAEIVFLDPDVPDTLLLTEIPDAAE